MVQLHRARCGQVLSWLLYFPHKQVVTGRKLWQAAAGDEAADASGQSVAAVHSGLRRLLSHPVTLGGPCKPEMSLKNHKYGRRTIFRSCYSALILSDSHYAGSYAMLSYFYLQPRLGNKPFTSNHVLIWTNSSWRGITILPLQKSSSLHSCGI